MASTACGRFPRSFQAETCMYSISIANLIHPVQGKKKCGLIVDWANVGTYRCAGLRAHIRPGIFRCRVELVPHGEEVGVGFPWGENYF